MEDGKTKPERRAREQGKFMDFRGGIPRDGAARRKILASEAGAASEKTGRREVKTGASSEAERREVGVETPSEVGRAEGQEAPSEVRHEEVTNTIPVRREEKPAEENTHVVTVRRELRATGAQEQGAAEKSEAQTTGAPETTRATQTTREKSRLTIAIATEAEQKSTEDARQKPKPEVATMQKPTVSVRKPATRRENRKLENELQSATLSASGIMGRVRMYQTGGAAGQNNPRMDVAGRRTTRRSEKPVGAMNTDANDLVAGARERVRTSVAAPAREIPTPRTEPAPYGNGRRLQAPGALYRPHRRAGQGRTQSENLSLMAEAQGEDVVIPTPSDDIEDIEFGLIEELDMKARHPQKTRASDAATKIPEAEKKSEKIPPIKKVLPWRKQNNATEKNATNEKLEQAAGEKTANRFKSPFLKSVEVEKRPLSAATTATALAQRFGKSVGAGESRMSGARTEDRGERTGGGALPENDAGAELSRTATNAQVRAENLATDAATQTTDFLTNAPATQMPDVPEMRATDTPITQLEDAPTNSTNPGITAQTTTLKKSGLAKFDGAKKEKSRQMGPTTIVSQGSRLRSNIGLAVAITLTVLVGGVVGLCLCLVLFQ